MSRLEKLLKGGTVQLSHDDIEDVVEKFPQMSEANYKKLAKAYRLGKGVRFSLQEDELQGSGFKSMAKKGAKSALKNKQLSKLKDQAINKGLDYALQETGMDNELGGVVKNLAKKGINDKLDEFAGSGLKSMAKRGAKSALKNKQLSKLKDQAINRGLDYALQETGMDNELGGVVKNLAKKGINDKLDEFAGSGMNKKLGRKILKTAVKGLKTGNKISNALGYDDLDDMAIDFATQQTLGRVDPTGGILTRVAEKELNKLADNKMEKMSGGSVNPYLPSQLRGGAVKVYNDKSNLVHSHHPAYKPSPLLDPQFDRLKLLQQQREHR